MKHLLKFFTVLIFLLCTCCLLHAQKHFIYIQSENQQPFAVVLNGKVFSSSDYGYIIIPKLADGKYDFTISFPMNKFPEQTFSCTVNKKDEGYALKNGTNGWALENLQTQKALANTTAETEKKNAFGNMLSDVVNDSTLTKKTLPPADTVSKNNTSDITDSLLQPQKISEAAADTGINMLFVDKTLTGSDTVNIFIPVETAAANQAIPQQNNSVQNADTVTQQINLPADTAVINNTNNAIDTTAHETGNPFYKPDENNTAANANNNAGVLNANNNNSAASNQSSTINSNSSSAVRQDCAKMITDDELNKLKRKMFSHSDDKEMIAYAVKYLNNKCITTDQVKSLGRLFSSDDGRYNLFDALYALTYDYGNYASLSSQIIDPYYKKRFQAMLR